METRLFTFAALIVLNSINSFSDLPKNYGSTSLHLPGQMSFLEGNNLQTTFINNGILNYDKNTYLSGVAGFIWPVQSSNMKTAVFASGLWIGAKVILPNNQHEIRTAGCLYTSLYSPGDIPVIGQVPPQSVCDDPGWKVYHVNLVDSTLVNGGIRVRTIGGASYSITYDSWTDWPVLHGAPYVDVNGIQGYQPGWNGDRPGIGISDIRPTEITFCVFMDYTQCTNNVHYADLALPGSSLPLGVEVQQLAYTFNCEGFSDSYFLRWKIINKSANIWDSTFVGLANDADVGNPSDDAVGCDSTRDLTFTYNSTNYDNSYGNNPPCVGTRLIQGPLYYTGNSNDTVRLPYRIYVGYKMRGLTSSCVNFNLGTYCYGPPPDTLAGVFNIMKGLDRCGDPIVNPVTGNATKFIYCGDACGHSGWFDSNSSDRRTYQFSGPVRLNPADTQIVVYSFIVARSSSNWASVCSLLSSSDEIRNAYYTGLCSSVIGVSQISSNVPVRYGLYQNYPNPFNPKTKIRFDLAGTGGQEVRLIVFDALGQKVSTLINGNMRPGSYETDWDSSNFPSGIYFYRLEAGNFAESKKMILIK